MARMFRGATLTAAVAGVMVLTGAGSAQARVDVTGLVAKPIPTGATCSLSQGQSATQAGQASDFCIAIGMSPGSQFLAWANGDDARNITIALPAGQTASAGATPRCTIAQFTSSRGCSPANQVGTVRVAADSLLPLGEGLINGKIYNLVPAGTEPARLGVQLDIGFSPITLSGAIKLQSAARLRAEDGGLSSFVVNSPRSFLGLPLAIRRMALTLWGANAPGRQLQRPFAQTNPDCTQDSVTRVSVLSYRGDTTSRTASYRPTDCGTLAFTPTLTTDIPDPTPDQPTEFNLTIKVPTSSNASTRSQGFLKNTTITLPQGLELSPTVGSRPGGLNGCTAAQFGYKQEGASTCPANSQIGKVKFSTPLLATPELEGKIFLRQPEPGGPQLGFYIVAEAGPEADALRVKIPVAASVDPVTGVITNEITDIIKTPFSEFKLTYFGGPHAVLATPRACGTYTTTGTFESYHGAIATRQAPITIDKDCASTGAFAPTFNGSVTSTAASQDTLLTTTLTRPAGQERLAAAEIELPTGLVGRLTVAEPCPLSRASTGDCSEASRVGTVNALAGSGALPTALSGGVYLTNGPAGALAGLAIVVDVKVGPIDFGRTVTQAGIKVRDDLGLTLSIPKIPLRQRGVEANIRQLDAKIEKNGFNINSSSCAPKQFNATLISDTGKVVKATAPYQATGCDRLAFAPTLRATLGGGPAEAAVNGHPSLTVDITQPAGEARTSKTSVALPSTISLDTDRLTGLCALADYQKNACPASAIKGSVTASTPLLPSLLTGPVTFVQVPGGALPSLGIDLRGALNLRVNGSVTFGAGNRITNVIEPMPDAPITALQLKLDGGANSVLIANTDLCQAATNRFDAESVSYGGQTVKTTVEPVLEGCNPAGTVRVSSLRAGRPTMELLVQGTRSPVTSSTLRLPTGLSFANAAAIRKALRVTSRGLPSGARARVTVSGRTLRVSAPSGQAATLLRVRLNRGAVKVTSKLRRAASPRLAFAFTATTKEKKTTRTTLRVRPR